MEKKTYAVIRTSSNFVIRADNLETFVSMLTCDEVTGLYDWGAVSSGRLKVDSRKPDFEDLSISIVNYSPEDADKDKIKILENELENQKNTTNYYMREHEQTKKREKELQESFQALQQKFERLAESVRPCSYPSESTEPDGFV